MKRALIISHSFPPRISSGVFRILRHLKYLPRNGWEAAVVTGRFWGRAPVDPGLEDLVPHRTRIYRALSPDLFLPFRALRRIGLGELQERLWAATEWPDHNVGWVPAACWAALRLFRTTKFDVVYSSAPPYSAHLVGLWLKRRIGLPWVADFRDLWSTNPYRTAQPAWTARLNRWLEHRVLASATAVTAISDPMRDELACLADGASQSPRFFTITNGYDGDMFHGPMCTPDSQKLVISYIGSLNAIRTARTFCAALDMALSDGRVEPSRLQVRFVSKMAPACSPAVARVLAHTGRVPHAKALRYMLESHVLVLLVGAEDGIATTTGKLFEYLGARRTILALAPISGAAAEIIRRTRSGILLEPDDVRGTADALGSLYARWRRGVLTHPLDGRDIAPYEGAALTRELVRVFGWAVRQEARSGWCACHPTAV